MHLEKVAWGGLTSYAVHDLAAGEQPNLAVVLCHGYGAPGTDLVALPQPLLVDAPVGQGAGSIPHPGPLPEGEGAGRAVFIFPAAPLDLAAQGMPGGRAWWPVDLDRLINRRTPELLVQFRRACPPGLPEARDRLLALLS